MFTVGRQTEYALFLINVLKGEEKPIALSEISRRSGLSREFLAKTATELKKAKILDSKEGARGGYWLKKDLDKISLGRIISLFEHKRIVSCFGSKKIRSGCVRHCQLKRFWKNLEREFRFRLASIKLAQIMK